MPAAKTADALRVRMRRWRRARPFWGGLLLIVAGSELLLIPLSGILLHGAVKLVVYIGIGGVFGVLIGALLVACGLLVWFTPAHRTFYAIAGVLLAVVSFITSNFGGFFVGMLLGITGGSLAFAWTPEPSRVPRHAAGSGRLAGAVMPLVLLGSLLGGPASGLHVPRPQQPGGPSLSSSAKSKTAQATPGLEASTAVCVITAASATLKGLAYQGTAQVPVDGGTQPMMKFTLSSLTLAGGVTATVTQNGQSTVTRNSSLAFTGGVTLYATKLTGSLLGIPLTLTPDSVISLLLRVLKTLTPLVPVTMTNVTTDQPLVLSGALRASDLVISG